VACPLLRIDVSDSSPLVRRPPMRARSHSVPSTSRGSPFLRRMGRAAPGPVPLDRPSRGWRSIRTPDRGAAACRAPARSGRSAAAAGWP
jgi:hypothetical protein